MKICVVIPALNEEATILSLVREVRTFSVDVVVINDGSSDKTGTLARQAGAIVIDHANKCGKGASLNDAFKYALDNRYDGIITMDADGQHAPSDLAIFLNKANESRPSLIAGNRMGNAGQMPFVRYLTNRFMSFIISCACRQRIPDTQCGYRYISARALAMISLSTTGFEIETEMLMKAAKKGIRIISIPVKTIYRDEESKISPLKDTIRFFRYFFRELWSSKE